jgi:hypothetical protein
MLPFLLSVVFIREDPFFFFSPSEWSFTLFRKPKCSSCDHIDTEFRRTAQVFGDTANLVFFSIDCKIYPRFCSKHRVYGVPSLLLLGHRRKVRELFRGRWMAESMASFLTNFTKIAPLGGFTPVHQMNATEIERAMLCGKCVAIPLFSPPVEVAVRETFDLLRETTDFLATTTTAELPWSGITQAVPPGSRQIVTVLNLFEHLHVLVNDSKNAASAVAQVCTNYHTRSDSYTRELVDGNEQLSLSTAFGHFGAGKASVEFAQNMTHESIDGLSRRIEALRKTVEISLSRERKTLQFAQKIVILTAIRDRKFKEQSDEEEL